MSARKEILLTESIKAHPGPPWAQGGPPLDYVSNWIFSLGPGGPMWGSAPGEASDAKKLAGRSPDMSEWCPDTVFFLEDLAEFRMRLLRHF